MGSGFRRICFGSVLLLLPAIVGGCADPLYPEDLPSSPYQRYMSLRGEDPPERNSLRGDPNLRQRLRPLGSP